MSDATKWELIKAEDEGWAELREVVDPLGSDVLLEDGYYPGWSVKDLLAHLGAWMAETAQALQQMRMGTYRRRDDLDEDELNQGFHEVFRDVDLHDVWAQLHSSRGRMLEELDLLPEDTLDEHALAWFRDSGAAHYEEHLPRLKEWVEELHGR